MQGWECPKCGKVYAPWVAQCTACAAAPGPVPSTPRPPTYPSFPRPRYGTDAFPENPFPSITSCFGEHITVRSDDAMPPNLVLAVTNNG